LPVGGDILFLVTDFFPRKKLFHMATIRSGRGRIDNCVGHLFTTPKSHSKLPQINPVPILLFWCKKTLKTVLDLY
jgi:hypothetical protein